MATNTSTVSINASAEKIWQVLTEPEFVKQWQYGSDLITDWKVGNPIKFSVKWEGTVFEQWGTVLEIIPNRLIKYNLFFPRPGLEDIPENYFIMSYVLTPDGTGVKLDIHQEDNRPGAVQEEKKEEENPVLVALKTLAEN